MNSEPLPQDPLIDSSAMVESQHAEASEQCHALPGDFRLHWYELVSVLGRGGFGVTYLARDTNLDRLVAIKEYLPDQFARREGDSSVSPVTGEHGGVYDWGLERFLTEARTLACFKHPNIVRVLSVFEHHNTAYMVMEYERGQNLASLFKAGKYRSQAELLKVFLPVMDGLQRVHQAGFIHRDIKPANIYIRDSDVPVLLDFGSARPTLADPSSTLTSLVTGGYAPYEQYAQSSGEQGPWTDIYALGATLYLAVTGRLPADALVRGTAMAQKRVDPYVAACELGKGRYSAHFLAAIDCALSYREADRPQTVESWIQMLEGSRTIVRLRAQSGPTPTRAVQAPVEAQFTPASPGGASADGARAQRAALTELLSASDFAQPHATANGGETVVRPSARPVLTDNEQVSGVTRNPGQGAAPGYLSIDLERLARCPSELPNLHIDRASVTLAAASRKRPYPKKLASTWLDQTQAGSRASMRTPLEVGASRTALINKPRLLSGALALLVLLAPAGFYEIGRAVNPGSFLQRPAIQPGPRDVHERPATESPIMIANREQDGLERAVQVLLDSSAPEGDRSAALAHYGKLLAGKPKAAHPKQAMARLVDKYNKLAKHALAKDKLESAERTLTNLQTVRGKGARFRPATARKVSGGWDKDLAKRASSKIAAEKPEDESQVFSRHLERAAAAIEADDFKQAESNLLTAELLRPGTEMLRPLWTKLAHREARFADQ